MAACLSGFALAPPAVGGTVVRPETNWTVYHEDPEGHGVAPPVDLSPAHPAWVSPLLDGQLYGEPLVEGSTVVVATEDDTVYALGATTGTLRWSTHLGTPVQASSLPCGDISPTVGITSTPVIDIGRKEVFVVADVTGSGGPEHFLFGLRLSTGAVELRQRVDPQGADASALLQRSALTLDRGHVVFGYGGNYGDCSTYHGWIVSVPLRGGPMSTFEIDAGSGETRGAVWLGGAAPEIDAHGNIWFAAGNGSVVSAGAPYDRSDAVIELSPTLALHQFFAPSDWTTDNANDRDLGSGAPALLASGLVVQAGKSERAFLLSAHRLGGIGGQLRTLDPFCGGDVDGGNAVAGDVVFMPCQRGIVALRASATPPSITVLWQSPGIGGPPIVADGEVWAITQGGTLAALSIATGAVVQQFPIGRPANHFATPSVGDGRLFAPGLDQVFAFSGG